MSQQSRLLPMVSLMGSVLACCFVACADVPAPLPPPDADVTAYVGAQVWDGAAFAPRSLYVRGDVLVEEPPGGAGRQVDLSGRFVLPPYTEAHHHVTGADDATSQRFLKQGVFYALNANTVVGPFEDRGDFFERPDTYDVQLAMGGVTEPGGHPEKLYVKTLTQYVYPDWTLDDFLGDAFHYARSVEELEQVLDVLQLQGSEIVKTYLLYSEEYAERRDDPEAYGAKGLNPEYYAGYVKAVQARGLPVAVHVETDHDALVAAEAGVDLFVHLPGYVSFGDTADLYALDDATVDAIKRSGAPVTPTYIVATMRYRGGANADEKDAHYALQAANIQKLMAAGVPILSGTDGFGVTPVDEVEHLHSIGGLSRGQAVQVITGTAAHLFPDRLLSCLDAGCEADFLALAGDPTADLAALREIELWVKAGRELEFPEEDPSEASAEQEIASHEI